MFAAVLIVCSLASTHCEPIGTEAIFTTEQACKESAAQFLIAHQEQIKRALGPYAVNLWCRKVEGNPA